MHIEKHDFDAVLCSQARLLQLRLLQRVEQSRLRTIAQRIEHLLHRQYRRSAFLNDDKVIRDLVQGLTEDCGPEKPAAIEVYIGLDTGFRSGDCQLWGVYDSDNSTTRLFIARNAKDLTGTILHNYMASQNCARGKCFEAEYMLANLLGELDESTPLPARMAQDIETLSPEEMLILLQNLAVSESTNETVEKIRAYCKFQLLDVITCSQLRKSSAITYVAGQISPEDLILQRLEWYKQRKVSRLPQAESVITLFKMVDEIITTALRYNLGKQLEDLVQSLQQVIKAGEIDVRADILALSFFCALRKYAFDDIYLEVTDRNPILDNQPDQAAIFAELFALGSHCESYFDMTSKALGKIIFDRYQAFYTTYPLDLDVEWTKAPATMYGSANPDEDTHGITEPRRGILHKLRQTSYIGVYSLPALIDILLLTVCGRGLYLSAFMGEISQRVVTFALLISLVISGGVSAWISCGGSYYLWARVYPAMNAFMVTRLIGGLVLVSIAGAIGIIVIGVTDGLSKGAGEGLLEAGLFFFYLTVFSVHLFMLAMLSNLQFPGSPLPSVMPQKWWS